MTGLFISVEGIDGSGKSTQAHRLAETLRAAGRVVTETREPGGSDGAEEIRQLLVTGAPGRWSPETEVLLFTAARRDHVERTIRPALAAGQVVVCDRYADSTRVYQGDDPERRSLIDELHTRLVGLEPELTLWFDLPLELAAGRLAERAGGEDRFEQKGREFQAALAARFEALAAACPDRIRRVDASANPDTVAAQVIDVVAPALPKVLTNG
ncbi:MAG: dTMP kinase [Pseudomonadota bacterium]